MSMTVKKEVTVINATYVEETESFLILGECENGRMTPQIHRTILLPQFNFDQLLETISEEDLTVEMHNFAKMVKGKTIEMVFDPNMEDNMKNRHPLKF
jgi:hypothetical protein